MIAHDVTAAANSSLPYASSSTRAHWCTSKEPLRPKDALNVERYCPWTPVPALVAILEDRIVELLSAFGGLECLRERELVHWRLNNKMRLLHAAPVHSTVLGSDVTEVPLRSRRKQNVAQ